MDEFNLCSICMYKNEECDGDHCGHCGRYDFEKFEIECVINKNDSFFVTIHVDNREIENKSDEEIADIIMNKLRIAMNKIIYGKRGV